MLKSPSIVWSGLLGFALGGFFDGILLHQILQWHHLLSLVPAVADLRLQVLWDGYFHALMYLLAGLALWGLWRTRLDAMAGRAMAGALLVGFGLWHLIDGVLSHWLIGIHRIRVDVDNPLFWDLLWLFAFGIVPLIAGWRLTGSGGRPVRPGGPAMLVLTLAVAGAGGWAMQAPPGQDFTTVVFRPGMDARAVMSALATVDGRLVWSDPAMGVVVVALAPEWRWSLYGQGALLVSGSGVPAGCIGWSRA